MCWARGIRHLVRPQLPRQCEQWLRVDTVSPVASDPQHDATLWPVAPGQWTTRTGHRPDSSKLRQGRKAQGTNSGSWRTIDASTQESSNNATSCTSWFSPAARPPPPRSQINHSILTQAESPCELGLLSVIRTTGAGTRVYSHWSLERSAALRTRHRRGIAFRSDGPCSTLRGAIQTTDRGVGVPSVLALIGAWDAVRGMRRFRGQNKCAHAMNDQLPANLSAQQPFHSNLTLSYIVSPGARHAMEKKKVLDGRCSVSLGRKFHSAVRRRTGSRISRGTGACEEL